jgi:hypothetical protein
MKYVTDLLKISAFILIIYLPIVFVNSIGNFQRLERNINEERIMRLNIVKDEITKLLEKDRVLEACQRLAAEKDILNIATYTVISAEGRCNFPDNMELPPVKKFGVLSALEVNGFELSFIRDKTRDTEWAISISTKRLSYINSLTSGQSTVLLKALVLNLFQVIYVIFAFIFLAVLILTKSIRNRFRKNGRDPFWLRFINKTFGWLQLQELKALEFATSASLKQSDTLLKDQDLLETSLEFSILSEIRKNNHNIPYTFKGTVAKVDINGFSKVVSAGNAQVSQSLTKTLEDFGCELLQRYKGLFEKTVGDEIVVVFKSKDSVLLAAAFSRDLMFEFSRLNFDVVSEKRNFTLKSSISSSELIFSKRAPGYGFLGDALTYATRLLDVVTIKDRNILSCLKTQASEIQDLVLIPSELKTFDFKNMTSAEGYLIDQFVEIDDIYSMKTDLIKYFRSNAALIFLLNKLKTETDFGKLNHIFVTFSDISVRATEPAVIATWIETLKIFEKRVAENPNLAFSFSRLITEGARLIPAHQWDQTCTDAIISISRYIEGRINASIVDVLIEKDLNQIAIEQEKSFIIETDQSFRTRGNLLINQAIHQLSDSVLDKVIKMINSNSALETSTGIYCACRIIIFYRKENPAELETYMSYRKLSKLLNDLYLNKNKEISPRLLQLLDQVNSYNELTYQEVAL